MEPMESMFTTSMVVISVVFPLIATGIVGLRTYVRRLTAQPFLWDDWTIYISLGFCWCLSVNLWAFTSITGLNTIKIDFRSAELQTFKFVFVNDIGFSVVIGIVKISVVLFYKRLFSRIRTFYITSWIIITLIGLWTTINLIITIFFRSDPISGMWTNPEETHLINLKYYGLVTAGISLCLDVIVLTMPLFVIHQRQMKFRHKLALMMIFWLGGFCCIASAMRFQLLYEAIHDNTEQGLYAFSRAFHWGEVEPSVAVIAASLPILRPLFVNNRNYDGSWLDRLWGGFNRLISRVPSANRSRSSEHAGCQSSTVQIQVTNRTSVHITESTARFNNGVEMNRM